MPVKIFGIDVQVAKQIISVLRSIADDGHVDECVMRLGVVPLHGNSSGKKIAACFAITKLSGELLSFGPTLEETLPDSVSFSNDTFKSFLDVPSKPHVLADALSRAVERSRVGDRIRIEETGQGQRLRFWFFPIPAIQTFIGYGATADQSLNT